MRKGRELPSAQKQTWKYNLSLESQSLPTLDDLSLFLKLFFDFGGVLSDFIEITSKMDHKWQIAWKHMMKKIRIFSKTKSRIRQDPL